MRRVMIPTIGPWEIDRTKRYYRPCIRRNGRIVAYLADNSIGVDARFAQACVDQDEANARLLLNSPQLFSCLSRLVAMNNCQYDRDTVDYRAVMTEAKAALAAIRNEP
jgi:hypothetical protein